jgi:uncharacterized damage-inducible protein DinB
MPIATQISSAAATYRQNGQFITKSFEGLTPEEWLRRPGEKSNSLLWIVGHVVWARSMVIGFLGSTWSRPWLSLFARGAKLVEPEQYPSLEEITLAWQDVSTCMTAAMEEASAEVLSAPAPEKSPSLDGKISGMVNFLAYHETYHVGQTAYLRTWLGHKGIVG